MKYGESDVEWQIGILGENGIHLSAFWNYFWKREEALKQLKGWYIEFTNKFMDTARYFYAPGRGCWIG